MSFRSWIETDSGLGTLPFTVNRGSNTPASDEVKRTGLQPQVDSNEIRTAQKDESDKILAIDDKMKHFKTELPDGNEQDHPKVNKFKKLWEKLREKWEKIKDETDEEESSSDGDDGLGSKTGDQKMVQAMQQNPNMMVTAGTSQVPTGPGVFGMG